MPALGGLGAKIVFRLGRGGSRTRQRSAGFSLIELGIVLLIVAILGGLAHSTFQRQAMRAHRAEALAGLGSIYISQETYRASFGAYGESFDEIGFTLEGGRRIDAKTIRGRSYTFSVQTLPLDGNPRGNFRALAVADLDPSDAMLDILMIENELTIGP